MTLYDPVPVYFTCIVITCLIRHGAEAKGVDIMTSSEACIRFKPHGIVLALSLKILFEYACNNLRGESASRAAGDSVTEHVDRKVVG